MPEYKSESTEKSATLAPGDQLDIEFTPKNPGTVQVHAVADPEPAWPYQDPVGRAVTLSKPDNSGPSASLGKTEPGWGGMTVLTASVTESDLQASSGAWTARVRNADDEFDHAAQRIQDQEREFKLVVRYPGDTRIHTQTVSVTQAQTLLAGELGGTEIRLDSGEDASVVRLPETAGGEEFRFTVPDFSRSVDVGFVSIRIRLGVNDLNSQQVHTDVRNKTSQFSNGSIRLRVPFEENGREITGTFNVQLRDPRIRIDLGLEVRDGEITYSPDSVQVETSYDADVEAIPDLVEGTQAVSDAKQFINRRIKHHVTREVRAVFSREDVHQGITDAITNQIQSQVPGDIEIIAVEVANGEVEVKFAFQ